MGGGPPARRPSCELRSARRLEARPGPATAHGHRSLAPQAPPAPSTPVVLCRWRVAGCVVLKPGQALPPPTGTAARPRVLQLARALRSLRRPPLRWCCVAGVWLGALACCLARPCRSLWASRGSRVLSFWGALVCVLLQTSSLQGVFCVDFCPVVTNVVNLRAFSLKMLVFGLRLTTFVTGVLVRQFELRWFDDVCNVCR